MAQLVTGEAVVLQVRIARMPTRSLATAIDVILQLIVLSSLLAALLGFFLSGDASPALVGAIVTVTVLLVMLGYPITMETLTRGRTLGKLALGLRVVRDDGSSIRFRQAFVRALLWLFVDFAPWFACCPGIVASVMNKQGKRIGDMVAGTVVIRERHQPIPSPALFVPGHLVQWAQSLELSRLSDDLANTAREYLARYGELEPMARDAIGNALAFRVGGLTAPPPPVHISAPAFLSAVLAERRRRELTRLGVPHGQAFGSPVGPGVPAAFPGTPPVQPAFPGTPPVQPPFGQRYAAGAVPPPTPYGHPSPHGAVPPAPPRPQEYPASPGAPDRSAGTPPPPGDGDRDRQEEGRPIANADGWQAPGAPNQWF